MEWALQEAKNRLSEVINRACDSGPQTVTRRGKKTAIILSYEDYELLRQPSTSLVEFLRGSPLVGCELEFERDRSLPREIKL